MAVPARARQPSLEIFILAGGLSTRMGHDKARLKLRGKTMLAHIRTKALQALPESHVRVLRKDVVPRCGPLGGILTALQRTRAEHVLFLACDMPLVSGKLLQRLAHETHSLAAFSAQHGRVGFPCIVSVEALPLVRAQIDSGEWSLQELARRLRARRVAVNARSHELFNVNSPEDLAHAESFLGLTD